MSCCAQASNICLVTSTHVRSFNGRPIHGSQLSTGTLTLVALAAGPPSAPDSATGTQSMASRRLETTMRSCHAKNKQRHQRGVDPRLQCNPLVLTYSTQNKVECMVYGDGVCV